MRPSHIALLFLAAGAACAAPASRSNERGEQLYGQCIACHALEAERNTPAGPTLHQVVGRPIASEENFNYSPALRRFASEHPRWTPELLDRFLARPEALVPGTEMGFSGLADESDRSALIAWLSDRVAAAH